MFNFGVKNLEITDEIVEYYRNNPNELDLLIDKEDFNIRFLSYFFIFGLAITIASRVISFSFSDVLGEFINHVVLDVTSEMGIAIFGGSITAYLLEYLQKKQYEANIAYRNEIKKRL
ncbi:hypothetical protein [Oceanivirga miroungae]|uniref:Uncharacterized protein n=1 Tax=Oceanivirga miroungae TaxID=1130046 RepID=A0A6I8MAX6_9FUSO|nr:hypothetical protein [Oceanivirga miroungae]VWL85343.1 hypothetical protein OMES3154_00628 [Oceanivirga miroungae]